MMKQIKFWIFCLVLCVVFRSVNMVLLFPAASVLQTTASLAIPIDIPGRKLYLDYGFQFNFDLPWNPASFYNPKFWPTRKGRRRRDNSAQYIAQSLQTAQWNSTLHKYKNYHGDHNLYHPHDFTAGEFYQSIENMLMRYGFHETCLLRAVCELARYPFDDDQENLLTETLTFVLTPSLHNAFAETEHVYREVYEAAEEHGFYGADCGKLYPKCQWNFLSSLTKVFI